MRSWIDEDTGSVCAELGWDDTPDSWQSCYSIASYPGPLVWTNPVPPSSGAPQMTFVIGLAPLDAATVEVRRGELVMGTTAALGGDTLDLGRHGFAVPLTVPDAEALGPTAVVPGIAPEIHVGTLAPIEVVAIDRDGVEVARAGSFVGNTSANLCFTLATGVLERDMTCMSTPAPPLAGLISGGPFGATTFVWAVVGPDAATIEMRQGDVQSVQSATAVPHPETLDVAPSAVAVFPADPQRLSMVELVVRDRSGTIIAEFSLRDFLGGEEGIPALIPGSL